MVPGFMEKIMKVYIGYECYNNYADILKTVVKVFDDEVKALVWKEEFVETETEFREYTVMTVE